MYRATNDTLSVVRRVRYLPELGSGRKRSIRMSTLDRDRSLPSSGLRRSRDLSPREVPALGYGHWMFPLLASVWSTVLWTLNGGTP